MLKTVCSGKMSYQAPCGGFQEEGVENHRKTSKNCYFCRLLMFIKVLFC